jgi:hypothetical protein
LVLTITVSAHPINPYLPRLGPADQIIKNFFQKIKAFNTAQAGLNPRRRTGADDGRLREYEATNAGKVYFRFVKMIISVCSPKWRRYQH